jgi:gamma-glutamyltranspeptidase/glutathione hydrolase
MSFNKPFINFITFKSSTRKCSRQIKDVAPLFLVSLLTLTSCGVMSTISDDFSEFSADLRAGIEDENSVGFLGGLATGEPSATLAGRDALEAGGNAVDAATAIYFNLAVTMPSAAGLGGGGVCIVHDAQSNVTKTLDFLARSPESTGMPSRRVNAVPGNVAGFHALHSRYGRLPWAQLVAPAEGLARFGFKVSRAFSHDLKKISDALLSESAVNIIFGRPVMGGLLQEGDTWLQPNLANVIGSIRKKGSAALYKAPGAKHFSAAVVAGGGSLSATDMTNYKPMWRNPIKVPLGYITVHFAPPPAAGGAVAAEILAMLLEGRRYNDATPETRPHLLIETIIRAYTDRGLWMQADGSSNVESFDLVSDTRISQLMDSFSADAHVAAASLNPTPVQIVENTSATSFAVMDEDGAAVACALSMNSLFGNGLVAKDTGVLMASKPGGGRGSVSLGPMLAVDHSTNNFFFAGAASGGVTAPTALMSVALSNAVNVEGLENAMSAKRLHHSGNPDIVYFEQGYDDAAIQTLIKKGHRVAETMSLGLVNAVGCSQGLTNDLSSCEAATDPRGFGLAVKIHN